MKRFWKDTLAAIAVAYLSGTALAQQVPMGLPPGPSDNSRQSVTPAPTPPPSPATPAPTPAPSPATPTTQAPPLANTPSIPTSTPGTAQGVGDYKIGSAKNDPPPECCLPFCCPAPGPSCCPAPGPVGCQDNLIREDQDCHRKWHWEVGAGIYYIQPNFKTNPAYKTGIVAGTTLTTNQTDFHYNMQAAPLGWVSWVHDCGWGVRGRWFQYDQGASAKLTNDGTLQVFSAAPANVLPQFSAAAGDVLNFSTRLRVEAWDLEGTYTFTACKWNFLLGAGVRYANIFESYNASKTTAGGTATSTTSVHTFNGAGPSFAIEGKRHFGESGLSFYGNARGAVLFGTGRQTSSSTTPLIEVGSITLNANSSQADVLPIGEVEVGLEWARECGRVRVFVQTGFVGQVWFGAGNAANVNIGPGAANNSTDFGFVGVAGRAGLTY